MVHLSEFIGEEVNTKEVEEGNEDLVCNPETVPRLLIEFISVLVEHVGPSHEYCQVNAEWEKQHFHGVFPGEWPFKVDDTLYTSV
jgi:hypothetical protein